MENKNEETYDDLTAGEILALRKEYLYPNLMLMYRRPVNIVRGSMQYLFDEKGKKYLDGFAGIVSVSVGHCHPAIVPKVQEQTARLQHTTTIYLHPTIVRLAKKLAEKMPDPDLKVSFFTNSGSEANELAVTTARMYTKSADVIALRNGYHGTTLTAMSLTGLSTWRYPVATVPGIHHVSPGYCYRCPYKLTYPQCSVQCAYDVENTIKYATNGKVAAFIAEPIQGVGGTIAPPPEYFKIVYEIVRKYGGLCIADEVQTGFGRTGDHYWGIQNWGVAPDIVTMAKGIGNGIPLGAITTKRQIAAPLDAKLYFNTFGGNPVSMVQGLATLDVIDSENIQANAKLVGGHLKEKLAGLMGKHPLIGEVRGMGLMLGIELVKDRESREAATQETADVVEHAKDMGLLVGKGGLLGNVLRIKPPMCLTVDDADFMVETLDNALAKAES
ncbi:MAG: aspartate aminotransferase family protein [Pseudomonadota bacterium]